ncbi:transcriptional regulator [Alkaliphilus pronyensis]|uniref:Transcriptional regulator n=1 Tax=Alkaliphilus pronyensis TaxID=1482732 RepID=A0A6I0F3C9_9FIRM|nr:transcriptional regulator [Alkaliphilus pronyensis]KAB3532929.1 transcriptional regulator [Alkaliphilus pronyensis]
MSKPKTKNDKAWEQLFDKYNIARKVERDGVFEITAKQINEFREARLMTKFDHRSNLPILFDENNLSILPITRGSYVISNFEAYHNFEKPSTEIIRATAPDFIHSIDFENITSEATAINVAYLSGILADFTGEETLLPTVNGRMSSESFDFNIYNRANDRLQNIAVVNSQIEIDGGFEGFDSLTLLEAKNSLSDDFLVRQLYYPFRLWQNKVGKPVKPVFLTYTNGVFNLYEYEFQDAQNYNSLLLVKQRNYTLEQEEISFDDILSLLEQIRFSPEPDGIPFPQADSFDRVINICELLFENEYLTREYITYNYDFDIRQTNYYTDACRYLGLVDKDRDREEGVRYFLTDKGKSIFRLNLKNRNLAFVKCILEMRAFNWTFREYLQNLEMPVKSRVVEIMTEAELQNMNMNTKGRRASSITGWLNWLIDLTR